MREQHQTLQRELASMKTPQLTAASSQTETQEVPQTSTVNQEKKSCPRLSDEEIKRRQEHASRLKLLDDNIASEVAILNMEKMNPYDIKLQEGILRHLRNDRERLIKAEEKRLAKRKQEEERHHRGKTPSKK